MVAETGVLVAGTGFAGSAVARHLIDPQDNAPFVLLDKTAGDMLLDIILAEDGASVAGALVARGGAVAPIRAPAVVLATGSCAGLFAKGDWTHSGDGLAIAHRAGLTLSKPHVHDDELRVGVHCGPDGSTTLAGLFVAGSLGADRPDPARVARAAILRAREGTEPLGPYRQQPTIDAPLPAGFADVKFDRLQQIMAHVVAGDVPRATSLAELHRLKGEADEFARARCDLPLYSLQNACEVAILLLRSA